MPAITEQPNKAPISRFACRPHPIHQGMASIVVRKDLLLSEAPYLWADVIVKGKKYLGEKHTVSGSGLGWQLLKGIPSSIVNEVRITSLTDCYMQKEVSCQ